MHAILFFAISCVALLWAANHLVAGATGLTHHYKLPPILVGLTVIALGTSLPELFFAFINSLKNEDTLVISNSIGSNIANISLVLGITILIKPTVLNYNKLKKLYPVLIIAMLFIYTLIADGYLGHLDGCMTLLSCIVVILSFLYHAYRSTPSDPVFTKLKSAMDTQCSFKINLVKISLGFIMLPLSAKYIITNAEVMASWLNMSQHTISLTIQAIGTTLPELSTAVIAALKNEEDLAVGTIFGSNIYNLLLLLLLPTMTTPSKVSGLVLWHDMAMIVGLIIFLLFLNFNYKKKSSPWHGNILVLIYFSFLLALIIRAPS